MTTTNEETPAPTATESRHSMASPDWMSPKWLVELAREVLDVIELDPASDEEANGIVDAERIYTKADNGLMQPWHGTVFHNPPGGLVAEFWAKFLAEWFADRMTAGIWVGYSLEQLQTLQQVEPGLMTPLDLSICVPKKRIAFVENAAARAARRAKVIERGFRPGAGARTWASAEACMSLEELKLLPQTDRVKAAIRTREQKIEAAELSGAGPRAIKAGRLAKDGTPPKNAPSHANYIVYVGKQTRRFAEVFGRIGQVRL